MKKFYFSLFLLFYSVLIFAQEYNFHGLPWGASRAQVVQRFGQPNNEPMPGILEYENIEFAGYRASLSLLIHIWSGGGLRRADYFFVDFENRGWMVAAHLDIRHYLTTLYGNSSKSKQPVIDYWNKNDFHVILGIFDDGIGISFFPDKEWDDFINNSEIIFD